MRKILISLFIIAIIICSSAQSFDWRIEVDPLYTATDGEHTYGNIWIKVYGTNNDVTRTGWSTPFKFTEYGSVIDTGIHIVNPEFENLWTGFWTTEESWDGDFSTPDQFNYSGYSISGFQPDQTERLLFIFGFISEIPVLAESEICIDSGNFTDDTWDWLFDPQLPFGGPYCWEIRSPLCGDFKMQNGPKHEINVRIGSEASWDFDASGGIYNYEPRFYESGPGSIDSVSGVWTYTPIMYDYGSRISHITGYDQYCTYMDWYFRVNVIEPCGDLNGDLLVNILDITYLIAYLYSGGPNPDPFDNADVNDDGNVNIIDITTLIGHLYSGGPDPICPELPYGPYPH